MSTDLFDWSILLPPPLPTIASEIIRLCIRWLDAGEPRNHFIKPSSQFKRPHQLHQSIINVNLLDRAVHHVEGGRGRSSSSGGD